MYLTISNLEASSGGGRHINHLSSSALERSGDLQRAIATVQLVTDCSEVHEVTNRVVNIIHGKARTQPHEFQEALSEALSVMNADLAGGAQGNSTEGSTE